MNNLIIGTAGHVDHGKTCLIRALTGIDTDRLIEEKKRGITIELGFAHLDMPDGQRIGIIDVPGHEKFVRNMLAGAGGIDLALLIVAADEGVMPQTIEHLGILSLLNIKKGIIVLTKTDLVDEQWQEMVVQDIRELVKGTFLQDARVAPVSSYTGEGIEQLRQMIFELAGQMSGKKNELPLRIPVDRVFTMEGFGTVITGTLIEGTLRKGEEVMLYPAEKIGKVRNLQVHSESVEQAFAGQRVAVNLSNLKKDEIDRGDVVAAPGSMHPSMMLDVRLQALKDTSRAIKNASRLHIYHGSRELLGKAVLLDTEALEPGQSGYAQLRLEESLAAKAGDAFIVRFYSPLETVGGGMVIDPEPQKHKRFDFAALHGMKIKEQTDDKSRLEQAVLEGSPLYRTLDYLCVQLGLSLEQALQYARLLIQEGKLVSVTQHVYLHSLFLEQQFHRLGTILEAYHKENPLKEGIKKEELRSRFLPRQEQAAADGVLAYYENNKKIKIINGMVSLLEFTVQMDDRTARLQQQIEALYLEGKYTPPGTDEVLAIVGKNRQSVQAHSAMITSGSLVRMDAQICFHRKWYDEAVELVRAMIKRDGQITLAECRDALGTSRKFAVAFLEGLDRDRITKKVGDARVLW